MIDNIQNCNLLPSNVVVSAIQGLCHLAARGDEKLLLPLLDHHDKSIAAALSSLCFHFGFSKKLINRIVQFASEYPTKDEECHELQRTAIFILTDLTTKDDTLFNQLMANNILNEYKESGVGTGSRSGRHGVLYNRAATELEHLAKTEGLLDEYRNALLKKANEFRQRAREINHPER